MKRLLGAASGLALFLTLAACGGDDQSSPVQTAPSPTPTPTPTSSPTPTPAPTPAPTPTPSPTPTPTGASYPSAHDYTAPFSFTASVGYEQTGFTAADGSSFTESSFSLLGAGQTAGLAYTPSPESAQFTYGGTSATFTGADRTSPPIGTVTSSGDVETEADYTEGSSHLQLDLGFASEPKYVNGASYFTNPAATSNGVSGYDLTSYFALFGPVTSATDTLAAGIAYPVLAGGISGSPAGEQATSSTDFGALMLDTFKGALTGTWMLHVQVGAGPQENTALAFSGTYDPATRTITGTIQDGVNGYTGAFQAQLFGPGGQELGLVFHITRARDQSSIHGYFVGGT